MLSRCAFKSKLHSFAALARRRFSHRVCGAGVWEANGVFKPSQTGRPALTNENGFQLKKVAHTGSEGKTLWVISDDTKIMYSNDDRDSHTPPLHGWHSVLGTCPPLVFDEPKPGEMLCQEFGQTPEGEPIEIFMLESEATGGKPGIQAEILSWGGCIRALRVPDKNGKLVDVVTGFDTCDEYLANDPFFGCITGRVANRVAKGEFSLQQPTGEEHYKLAITNGPNASHGGIVGFNKKNWQSEVRSPTQLALKYTSVDGEEGYPCTVEVEVVYTVLNTANGPTLAIDYTATNLDTEGRSTIINLTNHSYFNLSGDFSDHSIVDHVLHTPNTSRITCIDPFSTPTGELRAIKDTPYDFVTRPAALSMGRMTNDGDEQIKYAHGFDQNFIIDPNVDESKKSVVECARVHCPRSGVEMVTSTDEPGVQLYTGNFLGADGAVTGKGQSYEKRGAFCLETQHWPDAVNHPSFPSTLLTPDKAYTHACHYAFGLK